MNTLEEILFDVTKEIKKDFGIQGEVEGTPSVQTIVDEANFLTKIYTLNGNFFDVLREDLNSFGRSLRFTLNINPGKKSIIKVYSRFIICPTHGEKNLRPIFENNVNKINKEDREKISLIQILSTYLLDTKLSFIFPDVYLHFSTLGIAGEILPKSRKIIADYFSEIFDRFYFSFLNSYIIKKIKEINSRYLNFFSESFSNFSILVDKVDHNRPENFFSSLNLFLPYMRSFGLTFQGRYEGTILTKSEEEFLEYYTQDQKHKILWMYGFPQRKPIFENLV